MGAVDDGGPPCGNTKPSLPLQVIRHRDLNANDAKAITARIKSAMGDLMAEVVKAYIGRAWIALNYESWNDYIKGEFRHAPLHLPREERAAVVALLRGQGMSTRAIAAATGDSKSTVAAVGQSRDDAGVQNWTPDEVITNGPVTGIDGKQYHPPKPKPDVPEPKPKPRDPFLNRFYRHLSQMQDHALVLDALCKKEDFAEHRDAIIVGHREGVVWAHKILTRLLDVLVTDQGDLFDALSGGDD